MTFDIGVAIQIITVVASLLALGKAFSSAPYERANLSASAISSYASATKQYSDEVVNLRKELEECSKNCNERIDKINLENKTNVDNLDKRCQDEEKFSNARIEATQRQVVELLQSRDALIAKTKSLEGQVIKLGGIPVR